MSQLSPFVRAFRALGSAIHAKGGAALVRAEQLDEQGDARNASEAGTASLVLGAIADALNAAATDLEQQIARDLTRPGLHTPDPSNFPPPLGGPIDNDGRIFTNFGWRDMGVVYVTEEQVKAAEEAGWKRTGETRPFQGYDLVGVSKP
jgi:hypothetical protein